MTLDEAIRRNPYNPKKGNEAAYCRYLRYHVEGWYQFDSSEVLRRWQKMIATDDTKCLFCRWQDREHVQCFDGHLQRRHIKECEGYEFSEIPAQLAFKRQEEHHD